MEVSFGVIMLALVNGRPKVLAIKEVLHHYVEYRKTVIVRRTHFELKKAEDRAHREKELGYNSCYLDSGVNPSDYGGWDVSGSSVLVYVLEDAPDSYLEGLATVLDDAGAASILIFDREGASLYRKTPFDTGALWGQPQVSNESAWLSMLQHAA